MNGLRLYGRLIGVSMRAQLQYPASFAMQLAGHLLITGIEIVGVVALFARFGSLRGWSLAEVAVLYGLADVTFACSDGVARGLSVFDGLVKSGDFDRVLLRPRSAILQIVGRELTLRRIGRLAQGGAALVWGAAAAGIVWTPARALLLPASIAGGVCLFLGIHVLQATSAFWTVEGLEAWNFLTHGGNFASQYPMPIYRGWFRRIFTVVIPLALTTFLPGAALLGRAPVGWAAVAPLAGAAFLGVSLLVWRLGVRHYTSTGS